MKRSSLTRKTPLRRVSPATLLSGEPRPRKSKTKSAYRSRERDFDFMGWVKTQPCAAAKFGGCGGVIEADHTGSRGIGQKADDSTCIPLCTYHHRGRTDFSGVFKTWNQVMMRTFLAATAEATRARYVRQMAILGKVVDP